MTDQPVGAGLNECSSFDWPRENGLRLARRSRTPRAATRPTTTDRREPGDYGTSSPGIVGPVCEQVPQSEPGDRRNQDELGDAPTRIVRTQRWESRAYERMVPDERMGCIRAAAASTEGVRGERERGQGSPDRIEQHRLAGFRWRLTHRRITICA